MWKRLQARVTRRSSAKPPKLEGTVDEAVKNAASGTSNGKIKSQKTKKKQTNYETDEIKDVLKLFNTLEQLVVEGDPRVREVLDRRPLIQQALMDEGNITDRSEFSPRISIPKLQLNSPREPSFMREVSGVSGQPTMYRQKELTVSDLGVRSPRQTRYTQNRYQSNNPVIVHQTIPENSVLSNNYNISNYAGGKMRRQPDGTLLTTTNAPAIVEGRVNDVNPTFTRSNVQRLPQIPQPQRAEENPGVTGTVVPPQYHEFSYDTPRGKSNVQVKLRGDDKSHDFNYINSNVGYKVRVSLDNLANGPNNEVTETERLPDVAATQPEPTTQNIALPLPRKREVPFAKRNNDASWHETVTKVVTSEGGEIECAGCTITVPKNAVPNKALFRVSVLDIQQVPYTNPTLMPNERTPALIPITAALRIEPENLVLQKPVTVRLKSSVAMQSGADDLATSRSKKGKSKEAKPESDIKAQNVIIKHQNSSTNTLWENLETDVFRSSDSVTFRMQELSSVCAFYVRDGMNTDILIKKLAVYIFQSLERRKNQFLSVLVCEDLPHIQQKGVESMPGWLHYMDSCFNVSVLEGQNLVMYLEPQDRGLCSVDANKMEIPWENLWKPECIIRKHFRVTLHKRDIEAMVQLVVNEANYALNTGFLWELQRRAIFLPEPVPVQSYSLEQEKSQRDFYEDVEPRQRDASNAYKHVTWKAPTPESNLITNESLLRYATM